MAYALTKYFVPGVRPVILLVKLPLPVPSVVCEPASVGLGLVPQHTPLAVTVPPPSAVTLPPDTADIAVIEVTDAVVTVGGVEALVVNVTSFP